MPRVDNWRDQIEKELVTGCYEIKIADLEQQLEAERAKTTELKQKVDKYWEDRERIKQLRAGERRQLKELKDALAALQAPEAGA